jgi:hypothetical protein
MEAICTFETSVKIKLTTRRYIPEDSKLLNLLSVLEKKHELLTAETLSCRDMICSIKTNLQYNVGNKGQKKL